MAGGEALAAPTLSVIVPYYKGADVIRAAVQSVLEQTLQPDEIIICDDGSPDDLAAALGSLADRVKVVRKENGGISSAMNALTEAASGELLVQLDQDDAFRPDRLEAIVTAAVAAPDADVIATDATIEFGGEGLVDLSAINPFAARDQGVEIIRRCFFLWPAVRRSRLLAIGGYDESFSVMQDWECFIRLVLDGARVAFVDRPLYRWRLTPGSRSSSDGVENAEALIRVMAKTLTSPGLSTRQREAGEWALGQHRKRLALERAHLSVENERPDARRRSLELVTGRGFSPSTRLKSAVAVASPRLASRFIEARRQRQPGFRALAQRGFSLPRSMPGD